MMRRELLHIWGPFSIYSYGLAIALGLLAFLYLSLKHPWRIQLISKEKYLETVCLSLVVGLCGARLLFIISSWHRFETWSEILSFWSGGLSMMGGIIALIIFLPFYLKKINVPMLPFLDLAALFAPLLHAIARLGCFMAGCCYGKITTLPWAITYTDTQSEAPLHIPLHPAQLYTAALFLATFLFFYYFLQKKVTHPGQLFMVYLMIEGAMRFAMDFCRDDLEYFDIDKLHLFTIHQWLGLGMLIASTIGLIIVSSLPPNSKK